MPGVASEVRGELSTLEATAPQKYGYLRRNWRPAKRGLDNTDRTFARAADIHATIGNPDLNTRTLGYTMQILVDLDVLEAGPNRNAATLYDLRSYDPETLAAVGRAIVDG